MTAFDRQQVIESAAKAIHDQICIFHRDGQIQIGPYHRRSICPTCGCDHRRVDPRVDEIRERYQREAGMTGTPDTPAALRGPEEV